MKRGRSKNGIPFFQSTPTNGTSKNGHASASASQATHHKGSSKRQRTPPELFAPQVIAHSKEVNDAPRSDWTERWLQSGERGIARQEHSQNHRTTDVGTTISPFSWLKRGEPTGKRSHCGLPRFGPANSRCARGPRLAQQQADCHRRPGPAPRESSESTARKTRVLRRGPLHTCLVYACFG